MRPGDAKSPLTDLFTQAWNRYPGARVDVEVPYYGFSHPEIWSNWMHVTLSLTDGYDRNTLLTHDLRWKERYPSDTDLRAYFDHVAKMWDLEKDVECNVQIVNASFQEEDAQWLVRTANGASYRCKWMISATGTSFKQHFPDWKGRETFEGIIAHSSLWPKDIDISGKRVAIIGAGSTAVQIMQEGMVASSTAY